MSDDLNPSAIQARIKEQLLTGQVRFTVHAHQEMVEEKYSLDDVLEGLTNSALIENYPEHKRGACALFNGKVSDGRPIHIVCTTANPMLIVITVYEPKPPKWQTPTQRKH